MGEKKTGNHRGRPSKMKEWTQALQRVLEERKKEGKIPIISDEDIVLLTNQELKKSGHADKVILQRQFRRWKAGEVDAYGESNEFFETLQLAYIEMKDFVTAMMLTEKAGVWQKYSWILERKFSNEFALVHKQETTHKQETVIQITAGSKENQILLDSIMNGNAIDVQFTDVEPIKLTRGEIDNEKEDDYGF